MSALLRAVVVGINHYRDRRLPDLHFARNDARAVQEVLRGSTAFRLEAESSCVLLDAEATEPSVRAAIDRVFAQRSLEARTINLLYFAGHGIHWRQDDLTYLCCHEVDVANPRYAGICLSDIYKWFTSSSAECVIAILDTCFSGGLVVSPSIDYWSPAERAKQAIEILRGPDGKTMAFMAACWGNSQARENARYRHGIYTYHLLRGWRGRAGDDDGVVRLTGLVNYLERSFEQGWQKPASSIRGSGSLPLWRQVPQVSVPARALPPAEQPAPLLARPGALPLSSAPGDAAQTRAGFLPPPQATVPLRHDALKQKTTMLEQAGERAGLPPTWRPGPLTRAPLVVGSALLALLVLFLLFRLVLH